VTAPVPRLRLQRLRAKLVRGSFRLGMLARSRLRPEPGLRILLSADKTEWTRAIKRAFRHTRHELTFGQVADACRGEHDLLLPLTIDDLKALSRDRDLVARNPIPTPSVASIELCDDKFQLNEVLIVSGFGNLIPKMGTSLLFPYIVKRRLDEWGRHSRIVLDAGQEGDVAALRDDPDYFGQEFILGTHEYATHILFSEGRIERSLTIEYVFDTPTPIKGQLKPLYKTICRCPFLDLFASILAAIDFQGICCVNYKLRGGSPFVFEINPRIGGSLCPYLPYFVDGRGAPRSGVPLSGQLR
jgi:hypothetical protein